MTKVLVTGGAGYIGCHTVRQLLEANHEVVVVDNLYSGFRWAVDPRASFVDLDCGDHDAVCSLLKERDIEAVVHFAGHVVVPESVTNPLKYYDNNTVKSQRLIHACWQSRVTNFLFSSTAAVYGVPATNPIPETAAPNPINPYGRSKLMTEWMLQDTAHGSLADRERHSFRYVALRYFNVAGAATDGSLGQSTPDATHLIKVASEVATGKRSKLQIFGTDYPTADRTCVRDYIHVQDLADAHVMALQYLLDGASSEIINCGYGHGYSVREVIEVMRKVSGLDFAAEESGRRQGDPPSLIADNSKVQEILGWRPRYDDLELICRNAFDWESNLEKHRKQAS